MEKENAKGQNALTEKEKQEMWDRAVAFHGHECGGLSIGFAASLYAMELLDLGFSEDEEVVCISENDACGVDAIQVLLGCSAGKGNLLFKMRGKQAYSFYNRKNGKSVRLVLKESNPAPGVSKMDYMRSHNPEELFDAQPVREELPESARIFQSYPCSVCGEMTAESMLRLVNGEKVCLDCHTPYQRFR